MDNIINDYVKVEVPLNDEWHKKPVLNINIIILILSQVNNIAI